MERIDLTSVQEISGADVYGGATLGPLAVGLILAGAGYIVANWSDIKQGFVDGYYNR